ncbi:MAG TPA: Kazal-type serine protease inhibitor [Acidobacteriota bacterium]|nr:Kazal-type serine protease inhibitor [Acidobacteriota bacterium]
MKTNPLIYIGLAVLLVLAACTSTPSTPTNETTTSNSNETKYVALGEQCDLVRFMCTVGKEYFRDEVGCGCQVAQEQIETYYVANSIEQCAATTFICSNGLKPFFNESGCGCEGISDKSPQAMSFEAIAAMEPVTVKEIKGKTGIESAVPCHPSRIVASGKDLEVAYGLQACTEDYTQVDDCDRFVDFNENTATISITTRFLACIDLYTQTSSPSERLTPITEGKMCTMQYAPVCATFYDGTQVTFGNSCTADAIGIVSVVDGECATADQAQRTYCNKEAGQGELTICTADYNPVCGWNENSVKIGTFSNQCGACVDENVMYTTPGECQDMDQTRPADDGTQGKRVVFACDEKYVQMQSDDAAACTKEYRPVCATDAADAQRTFGNVCMACTTKGVFEYTEGECNTDGAMI